MVSNNNLYLSWEDFKKIVSETLNVVVDERANPNQYEVLTQGLYESMQIIAGPGSGKTWLMTLLVLKKIFVEGISPKSILVTTFTKKAATELSSRILEAGDIIVEKIREQYPTFELDLNQIRIGTLDSIIQELLTEFRGPGTGHPLLLDEHGSKILLTRAAISISPTNDEEENLIKYLEKLNFKNSRINYIDINIKVEIAQKFSSMFIQYLIDLDKFTSKDDDFQIARKFIVKLVKKYWDLLNNYSVYDFLTLKLKFLTTIKENLPYSLTNAVFVGNNEYSFDSEKFSKEFLEDLKFIFIDEYQDTNYLQEQIYFQLTKIAKTENKNVSVIVVGDEDQAIYRFRGGNVLLFTNFKQRIHDQLGINPKVFFLNINYRSQKSIIDFYNNFINLFPFYQDARSTRKPQIIPNLLSNDLNNDSLPIVILNGTELDEIASKMSEIITNYVKKGEIKLQVKERINYPNTENEILITGESPKAHDITILQYSPREYNQSGEPRLGKKLRDKLEQEGIYVYNPRGKKLRRVREVIQLLGVLLLCIDPDEIITQEIKNNYVIGEFRGWRREAEAIIDKKEFITTNNEIAKLKTFKEQWEHSVRKILKKEATEGGEVIILELIYNLLSWFPELREESEGVVYIEAILSAVKQSSLLGIYEGKLIYEAKDDELWIRSVKEFFNNVLIPIVYDTVELDEELDISIQENKVSIYSIHQSKGLEFPIVFVDIGSYWKTNHHMTKKYRFPENPEFSTLIEEEIVSFSDINIPQRDNLLKTFDDLIRLYYVAYSRAKDLLILVCHDKVRSNDFSRVKNIQTGWLKIEDGEIDRWDLLKRDIPIIFV